MLSRPSILIIDGDDAFRLYLRRELTAAGYKVHEQKAGTLAMDLVASVPLNLIILDPDLSYDGPQPLLRSLRAMSPVPILGLLPAPDTARMVQVLDGGAQDCVAKPFFLRELLARIRKLLRQAGQANGGTVAFSSGDLDVDLVRRQAYLRGGLLALPEQQFDVLTLLVRADGAVLPYRQLLEQVWGPGNDHRVQYLRRTINQLRRKIEPDPRAPVYILTAPRIGYRLIHGDVAKSRCRE